MSSPLPTPVRQLHPLPPPGRATPAELRVGDVERTRVCDALAAHYAAGRLSSDELDVRLGAATTAITRRDLDDLLIDLPHTGGATPGRPAAQSWTAVDVLALVAMAAGCGLIALMLVGATVIAPLVAVFALIGGSAAAVTGGLIVHLIYRSRIRSGR